MPVSSRVPFPAVEMDPSRLDGRHPALRRSTRDVAPADQYMVYPPPPLPQQQQRHHIPRPRRYSEQVGPTPRSHVTFPALERPLRPVKAHTESSSETRSSGRSRRRHHHHQPHQPHQPHPHQHRQPQPQPRHHHSVVPPWAGHDSSRSEDDDDDDDDDSGSRSFTLLSSSPTPSDAGAHAKWGYPHRSRTLDPYRPTGMTPNPSQVYIITSHAPSHAPPVPPLPHHGPRRRATSLLKCLTRGGLALFDINPRWAKRRPLL